MGARSLQKTLPILGACLVWFALWMVLLVFTPVFPA